tara:strand:- start:9259 stop:17868 length:8610 start_codon:yes stop_codon:yes gene_type:complete
MLKPDKLKKLNDNARVMAEQGKSKEEILAMKGAFIEKFGATEPVKKKESTQPETSSSTLEGSSKSVPTSAPLSATTSTRSPNNLQLEDDLKKANSMLQKGGVGVGGASMPFQMNTQGDVLQNAKAPSIPKKSTKVIPVGSDSFNQEQVNSRLSEVQSALNNELSYAKTDEQRKDIQSRYDRELNSLESQVGKPSVISPLIKESPKDMVRTENVNLAKIPKKKELPVDSPFQIGENGVPQFKPTFELDEQGVTVINSHQNKLFDAIEHNQYVDALTAIEDIDDEELKKSKDFTPEQVGDILKYKENAFKVNDLALSTSKKASIVAENQKKLQENIQAQSEAIDIINAAAVESKTVSDVLYEAKKANKDALINLIPNEDMKGVVDEHTTNLYELRDLMALLTDKNGGQPKMSFDDKGEVVMNGFANPTQQKFYQDKLNRLLKQTKDSDAKFYNVHQDKITNKELERFELQKKIKSAEAYLSKLDQSSAEYQQSADLIYKDKGMLKQYDSNIERMKTEGNIIFKTNPEQVAKTLISDGGEGLMLSFSNIPGNLSPKEKFDVGYERLMKTVQRQEQELGADKVTQMASMILKDRVGQLSKDELSYLKNKQSLSSMAPMYLMNESGVTNESDNFLKTLMAGFARWTQPNTSGKETQTKLLQKALESSYNVGANDKSFNEDNFDAVQKRAEGPQEFWNQESWGEVVAPTLGIVADMAAGGAILKLAKIGAVGSFADELYNVYESSMKSTKLGRFFLPVVDNAAKAEATGQIMANSGSELNLENFLVGGTAAKMFGSVITALPASKKIDMIMSIFGQRGKDALTVIANKTAGGAGEVVEETMQELTGIYYDELRDKGFWDEAETRFGTFDDIQKFVATTFLMGLVMQGGVNDKAKEEYQKLSPEKKAQVDAVMKESVEDINSVNHDLKEVVDEEVKREDVVEAIEKEANIEEPIAPEAVVEEVKAEEEAISETKTTETTNESTSTEKAPVEAKKEPLYRTGVPSATGRVDNAKTPVTETAKKEIPDENKMVVYHGGTLDAGEDNTLYTSPDKVQSEEYAKNNDGYVTSFEIDKTKTADEDVILETIDELGLKSPSDRSSDEIAIFELLDPRFEDTALSEEEVQSLFDALKAKGYESAMFTDEDVTLRSKTGVDNIVIFDKQSLTEKSVESDQKNADDLFEKGYKPVINGEVKVDATQEDIDNHFDDNMKIEMVKPSEINTNKNGTTEQSAGVEQGVTSDTPIVKENKGKKAQPVKKQRKGTRSRQAQDVKPINPRQAVLNFFVSGGRISEDTIQEIYGSKDSPGRAAKDISGEVKARASYLDKKTGQKVDAIAERLYNQNVDEFPNFETQDYKNALIDVIQEYNGRQGMIDELISTGGNQDMTDAEYQYYENTYGPEAVGNEDYVDDAELFYDNLTEEEKQTYMEDFDSAQAEFEAQYESFENSEAKPEKTKSIKEKTSSLSEKIRSLKAPIDLSSLSSSPKPVFDAAWNTAVEAAALVVDGTGTIAQAVEAGIKAIGETKWFQELSEDSQKTVEDALSSEISKLEKVSKPKKPYRPKKRKSAMMTRALEKVSPEMKDKLVEDSYYEPQNNKESYAKAKEVYDALGYEASIDYAEDILSRKSATLTQQNQALAIKAVASALRVEELNAMIDVEIDPDVANLYEDELMSIEKFINSLSQQATARGQANAFLAEVYSQHGRVFENAKIAELDASRKKAMRDFDIYTDENGNPITVSEKLESERVEMAKIVRKALQEEFGGKISELEAEIESLRNEKPSNSSYEAKAKAAKRSFKSKLAQFNAISGGGNNQTFNSGLASLFNEQQIKLIKGMAVDLAQIAGNTTASIISEIYKGIKGVFPSGSLSKEHVSELLSDVEELNDLRASEAVLKKEKLIASLEKKLEELIDGKAKDPSVKNKDTDAEIIALKEKIENVRKLKTIKGFSDLTGENLMDILKEHYSANKEAGRTLSQLIISRVDGITVDQAQRLAKSIESKFQVKVEKAIKTRLDRILNTDPSTTDLLEKRDNKTITPEEQILLDKKLNQRGTRTVKKKVIEAIMLGAVSNNSDFSNAFAGKFKFNPIDPGVMAKLTTLAHKITAISSKVIGPDDLNVTQRETLSRLEKEFNTILDSVEPKKYWYVAKEIIGLSYLTMLSRITSTGAKALFGTMGTMLSTAPYIAKSLLTNPAALWQSILNVNLAAASARASTARRTGLIEVGQTKIIGEFDTRGSSATDRTLMEGMDQAFAEGKVFKGALKGVSSTLLGTIRAMMALDAFTTSVSGDLFQSNALAKEAKRKGVSISDYAKSIRDARNGTFKDIAENEYSEIENEARLNAEELALKGVIPNSRIESETKRQIAIMTGNSSTFSAYSNKKKYVNKRIQEIDENQRYDDFKEAWSIAHWASLIGTADGFVGSGINNAGKSMMLNKDDNAFMVTTKLFLNATFRFLNLTSNFLNETINSIPVIGILNIYLGRGYNNKTGEYEPLANFNPFKAGGKTFLKAITSKYRANPTKTAVRLSANLLSTAIAVWAMMDMYEDDPDDPEKKILNPNRMFDVPGSGFRDYNKNENLRPDFEEGEIGVRNEDGTFTYYSFPKYIPWMNAITATLAGAARQYSGFVSDEDKRRYQDRPIKTAIGNVVDENLYAFMNTSFNSIGRLTKPFIYKDKEASVVEPFIESISGPFLSYPESILNPGVIKDTRQLMETRKYETERRKVLERAFDSFGVNEDKTDMFGNKFPEVGYWDKNEMAKMYPKTAGLHYKFADGAPENSIQIGRYRPATGAYSEFTVKERVPFSTKTKSVKYFVNSEDLRDETLNIQKRIFGEMTEKDYARLNKLNYKDLDSEMRKMNTASRDLAEKELVEKYLDKSNPKSRKAKIRIKE